MNSRDIESEWNWKLKIEGKNDFVKIKIDL